MLPSATTTTGSNTHRSYSFQKQFIHQQSAVCAECIAYGKNIVRFHKNYCSLIYKSLEIFAEALIEVGVAGQRDGGGLAGFGGGVHSLGVAPEI